MYKFLNKIKVTWTKMIPEKCHQYKCHNYLTITIFQIWQSLPGNRQRHVLLQFLQLVVGRQEKHHDHHDCVVESIRCFELKISRGDYNYSTPLINRMIFHNLWLSLSHTHTCANTHTHQHTQHTHICTRSSWQNKTEHNEQDMVFSVKLQLS